MHRIGATIAALLSLALAPALAAQATSPARDTARRTLIDTASRVYKAEEALKREDSSRSALLAALYADSVKSTEQTRFAVAVSALRLGQSVLKRGETTADCDAARDARRYFTFAGKSMEASPNADLRKGVSEYYTQSDLLVTKLCPANRQNP
ncbi:MAG: hypothetical protein ABJD07_07740 [Gemmatimonadaceae bacterium]